MDHVNEKLVPIWIRDYVEWKIDQKLGDKPPLTSRADSKIPERGEIRVFGEFRLMPLSGSTHLCHSGEILDCRIERRIPGDTDTYRDFAYFRNGSDAALVISVLASSQPSGGFNQPAGGPPTPDLTAQPDSNKKNPRIGVHNYDSLVSCLRTNFEKVFDSQIRDPQDMIQMMVAEIQTLRRHNDDLTND